MIIFNVQCGQGFSCLHRQMIFGLWTLWVSLRKLSGSQILNTLGFRGDSEAQIPVHALSSIPLIVFNRKLCTEEYRFNSNSHHSKEDIQLYLKNFPLHITEKNKMAEGMEEKEKEKLCYGKTPVPDIHKTPEDLRGREGVDLLQQY